MIYSHLRKNLLLSNQIRLPQTPEVIVKDRTVVICYPDGTEMIWGEEETLSEALRIAQELEVELRAVNYVRWQVRTFITEMVKTLQSIDADEKLIISILRDGHAFAFNELDPESSKALSLDERPDIKQAVIKKLDELYII
jgi:hypothetical protein